MCFAPAALRCGSAHIICAQCLQVLIINIVSTAQSIVASKWLWVCCSAILQPNGVGCVFCRASYNAGNMLRCLVSLRRRTQLPPHIIHMHITQPVPASHDLPPSTDFISCQLLPHFRLSRLPHQHESHRQQQHAHQGCRRRRAMNNHYRWASRGPPQLLAHCASHHRPHTTHRLLAAE